MLLFHSVTVLLQTLHFSLQKRNNFSWNFYMYFKTAFKYGSGVSAHAWTLRIKFGQIALPLKLCSLFLQSRPNKSSMQVLCWKLPALSFSRMTCCKREVVGHGKLISKTQTLLKPAMSTPKKVITYTHRHTYEYYDSIRITVTAQLNKTHVCSF